MKVIEDVRKKYACDCTVKTAAKPAQPIEKSTAGASLLAHVIVASSPTTNHCTVRRRCSSARVCGSRARLWAGGCRRWRTYSNPLYEAAKRVLFESKVVGTDDTGVKVLDRKLPFARTGRIWPYLGDAHHPVVFWTTRPTRGRDGPSKFLKDIKDTCKPTPTRSTMPFSSRHEG